MDFQRFFKQSPQPQPAAIAKIRTDTATSRRSPTGSASGPANHSAAPPEQGNLRCTDPRYEIELRRAQLGDLPALTNLLTDSFHHSNHYPVLLQAVLRFSIQEDLRQRLQQKTKNHACWVAIRRPVDESEDASPQLVGTVEMGLRSPLTLGWPLNLEAWLTLDRTFLYVSNLAVSDRFRRQGIAQYLLRRCEQTALAWHYSELYLHVLDGNQAARNLYSLSGFRFKRVDLSLESVLFNRDRRQLWCKTLQKPTPSRLS